MRRVLRGPVAVSLGTLWVVAAVWLPSSCARAQAGDTIVLTGARLIDGTGRGPIDRATLVIADGRVQAVGAAGDVQVPAGATSIDLAGKTIVPGFINAHAHVRVLDEVDETPREQLAAQLRLYADYGVTTIVSLGDDGVESVRLRDEQREGRADGARLYVSGPNVVEPTAEAARETIDRLADAGVDVIKTRLTGGSGDMPPEVYGALIDQAHRRGLRVAAHVFYLDDARGLVDAGVDVLAHSVRDRDMDDELIDELRHRDIGVIPTLARELSVFVYESTPEFFSDPFFLRHAASYRREMEQVIDPAFQERTRTSEQAQSIKLALAQAQQNLKRLVDAGVPVAMGTDTGASVGRWQGYFEHVELALMVEAGLDPMQAIVAATGDAARVMQLDAELGTLEPGKWADFVVLNADPLADIANTREIDAVWMAGRRLTDEP